MVVHKTEWTNTFTELKFDKIIPSATAFVANLLVCCYPIHVFDNKTIDFDNLGFTVLVEQGDVRPYRCSAFVGTSYW